MKNAKCEKTLEFSQPKSRKNSTMTKRKPPTKDAIALQRATAGLKVHLHQADLSSTIQDSDKTG